MSERFLGGFLSIEEDLGSTLNQLTDDLMSLESANEVGAITSFVGIVRSTSDSEKKRVIGMEVEHWEERGKASMTDIATRVGEKFGLVGVRIFHVYGKLSIGDPIVFVVLASKHRKEAFEAMEESIHLYKTESPVWKKEIYEDKTDKWIFTGS